MKSIVVYFSPTGTTKKIAEMIADSLKCPIFEIKSKVPYTEADLDWEDRKSRSSIEMDDSSSRPEIEESDAHIEQYDVIYLGYPVWWYVAPTIMNTFLEQYDFTGKKIILFATSGSTDEFGRTVAELTVSAPNAIFEEGMILNDDTRPLIDRWENLVSGKLV